VDHLIRSRMDEKKRPDRESFRVEPSARARARDQLTNGVRGTALHLRAKDLGARARNRPANGVRGTTLHLRARDLRARARNGAAHYISMDLHIHSADAVGTGSTQGRGSACAFGEERAVVTGEKATGRVVAVAALCRQAVTSRRHAVTWRRRLLASFVASAVPPRLDPEGSTPGFLSGHGV
jgi:hypothetical protein